MRQSTILCLLALAGPLRAADPIDRALVEHADAVAAAEAAFDRSVAAAADERDRQVERSRRRAVQQLERLARSATRRGELATASRAWREILALEPGHAEATAFVEAVGGDPDAATASVDLLGADGTGEVPLATVAVETARAPAVLREGASFVHDFDMAITALPDELDGAGFLPASMADKAPVVVRATAPGRLYVIGEPGYIRANELVAAGFERCAEDVVAGIMRLPAFSRTVARGERLELPPGRLGSVAVAAGGFVSP